MVRFAKLAKVKGSSIQCLWFCWCIVVDETGDLRCQESRTIAGAVAPADGHQNVGLGRLNTRERQPDLGFAPV